MNTYVVYRKKHGACVASEFPNDFPGVEGGPFGALTFVLAFSDIDVAYVIHAETHAQALWAAGCRRGEQMARDRMEAQP